jgi:hypothetical protein
MLRREIRWVCFVFVGEVEVVGFVRGEEGEQAEKDREEDAAQDPVPGGGVGAFFVDHGNVRYVRGVD